MLLHALAGVGAVCLAILFMGLIPQVYALCTEYRVKHRQRIYFSGYHSGWRDGYSDGGKVAKGMATAGQEPEKAWNDWLKKHGKGI